MIREMRFFLLKLENSHNVEIKANGDSGAQSNVLPHSIYSQIHIETDRSIPPDIHAARKVPINIRVDIAKELNKMVQDDVITSVTHLTKWVLNLA